MSRHPRIHRLLIATLWPLLVTHAAPPSAPELAVLKPTFMTGVTSFSGGTAFVCQVDPLKKIFILTAHHLFGPACGLEKNLTWKEVPEIFLAVTGLAMADPEKAVTSTQAVAIPGAQAFDNNDCRHDLAAYLFPKESSLPHLQLAAKSPAKDENVFLLGRQRGSDKLEFLAGKVVRNAPEMLEYRFERTGLNLAGTSGAPVLNDKGEVIAINLGGYEKGGAVFGFGNPCESILDHLRKTEQP
jgi:Trypsin-like peptidase domain